SRMGIIRKVLSELEKEGFLVKGFLLQDDPTLRWILATDQDLSPPHFKELFLLNTQDNLHYYLRDQIKKECGSADCVVYDGTEIIGWFKGKVDGTGAKIEEFQGSDKANLFIKKTAKACGVRIEEPKKEENEDWDVSEFYLKTNPGA
ncbi:MAG: hypothetical protein LBV63_03290, partial [Candidatus Methanoplasma sp.]|nr:hypothetical protein [Candidatus Methanoplasma sp.]